MWKFLESLDAIEEFNDPENCYLCHIKLGHSRADHDKVLAEGWRPPHLRTQDKRTERRAKFTRGATITARTTPAPGPAAACSPIIASSGDAGVRGSRLR